MIFGRECVWIMMYCPLTLQYRCLLKNSSTLIAAIEMYYVQASFVGYIYNYNGVCENYSCAGEWWNDDVEQVELAGLRSGGAFAVANATVINGHPGAIYNCSISEGNEPVRECLKGS